MGNVSLGTVYDINKAVYSNQSENFNIKQLDRG